MGWKLPIAVVVVQLKPIGKRENLRPENLSV